MILGSDQQAQLLKVGNDFLSGFETIEPDIRTAGTRDHRVAVNHSNQRQSVPLPCFEIIGIMCGCELYHAGAEPGIRNIVEDDGNLPIHQRKLHRHQDRI